MEQQYIHTVDGQAVLKADLDRMGEGAALADDRVIAEFLRLAPYNGVNVSRCVIPSGVIVGPNGGTGTVMVAPFRAIVGSRTTPGVDAKKAYRDIRSAISADTFLTGPIGLSVVIADNASGNGRWDLIYAIVSPDVDIASTDRKAKNLTTDVVANVSVPAYRHTTVTVAVVTGTPSATPDWPAVPSDGVGTFIIPLAYAFIPDAFDDTQVVNATDICIVAPCLPISECTGAANLQVANTAQSLTTTEQENWAGGSRPPRYMPSTMQGAIDLLVAVDLTTGSVSHANNAVVDDRDWRKRLCTCTASVYQGDFAWEPGVTPTNAMPSAKHALDRGAAVGSNAIIHSMGQTFVEDTAAAGVSWVSYFAAADVSGNMAGGTFVALLVNQSDGKLKINYVGAPNATIVFWIRFSGRFENAA